MHQAAAGRPSRMTSRSFVRGWKLLWAADGNIRALHGVQLGTSEVS